MNCVRITSLCQGLTELLFKPAAFTALTAGTQKGIWTYLAEHDGPFKAGEVAKVKEIDPPLLCKLAL